MEFFPLPPVLVIAITGIRFFQGEVWGGGEIRGLGRDGRGKNGENAKFIGVRG